MNYLELQKAKETYRYVSIEKERQEYYKAREAFVEDFTLKRIAMMSLDEYVIGRGDKSSFCYRIERELGPLGHITGQPSNKFGVWYSKQNGDYKAEPRFGDDISEAFGLVKDYIIELIEAGSREDFDTIIKNPISAMFKGKILSTYFPETYLNIFSKAHLKHYLIALNLDTIDLMQQDPVIMRQALVDFKNSDQDMKHWKMDMFAAFLWSHYPGAPINPEETAVKWPWLKKPEFPQIGKIKFVELKLASDAGGSYGEPKATSSKSPDYEAEAASAKELGDRGEHIVMEAEIERLMNERGISKMKASKLVKHVSRESDSYGYDILSVNPDNSPRYIEVKATQGKVGDMTFYYTANELATAKKYSKAYYLYIVYEITSKKPKIWILQNPFLKDELKLVPIKYKVNLKTK